MRHLGQALVAGFLIAGAGTVHAQVDYAAIRATRQIEAIRIDEPIVLDGRLDEPAWTHAPAADDFVEQEPVEGNPPSNPSEVRFLYDADALYVGGRFFDSDPRGGITNDLQRDFVASDSDVVAIILDPLNDLNSVNFKVNPGGAIGDSQSYDDGRQVNQNWDAVWWAKTATFPGGWTMEMKIPFKSLRFPDADEQVWGVNVFRNVRRLNERAFWSPQPRQFTGYKASYCGRLTGIRHVRPGRNLYIKPFITGALSNVTLPNLTRRHDADGGIDAKYGVGTSLVLDLTYRTDFSQVEVDAQQINLTRFSLIFPEKREFFLENQGAFRIGDQDSSGRRPNERDLLPFFSRRIGLSADGQPIPIVGGARLTGRQGNFGLGLLNIQTHAFGDRPGDNFTAAHVTREFGASSIGGFYLGREASGVTGFNRVAGGDIHLNFRQTIDVYAFAMGSASSGGVHGRAARAAFRVDETKYGARLSYTNISPDFRDDLGFIPRRDIGLLAWDVARHFRPERMRQVFRTLSFGTLGERFENSRHEQLLSQRLRAYAVQEFAGGGSFETDADWNYELLTQPFEVSRGVVIPAGEYRFRQILPSLSTNRSRALSVSAGYTGGEFYSGTIRGYSAGARWRLSPNLSTSGEYEFNDVHLPQGRFHAGLARIRLDCAFTTTMFLNAFVQYNSASRTWLTNLRYRLIYRPLSDLYVVFNETRQTGKPAQRAVVLKQTILLAF